jgi:hypothetical protein
MSDAEKVARKRLAFEDMDNTNQVLDNSGAHTVEGTEPANSKSSSESKRNKRNNGMKLN